MLSIALIAYALACSTQPSFNEWAEQFGKNYTITERDYRISVYEENVAMIDAHNAKGLSWTMAVNEFADLTADEFKARFVGQVMGLFNVTANSSCS